MYGLIVTAGIFIALWYAEKEYGYKHPNTKDTEKVWSVFSLVLIFGIIGARLYHVIDYFSFYSSDPIKILQIWNGGLGIYGAILGGLFAVFIYGFINKFTLKDLLEFFDIAALALPIGQFIGRWANFFNEELFGLPSSNPLAIYISAENRPSEYASFRTFHPLFLYESLGMLFIFIFLSIIKHSSKFSQKLRDGDLFYIYLCLYGILRIILEPLRINHWNSGLINVTVLLSILLTAPLAIRLLSSYLEKSTMKILKEYATPISVIIFGVMLSLSLIAHAVIVKATATEPTLLTESEAFISYAKDLGLNEKEFTQCLNTENIKNNVLSSYQQASAAGIKATPTFLINGIYVEGAQPFDVFQNVIELIERNDPSLAEAQRIEYEIGNSPMIGNPNAPITIIEFSDFQCPFCSQFVRDAYPQIKTNYIETGKAKLIFKDYPIANIHPNAVLASVAAQCANTQGAFWEYHDKLFETQNEWKSL